MNYKDLFKRVISLISSPAKAWEEIGKEEDRRKVLGAFVYPMIGLCGLSVFIGTFIGNTAGVAAFQIAMTRCCAIFVSLFGGYFLAAYAIDQLGKKLLGREDQYELNSLGQNKNFASQNFPIGIAVTEIMHDAKLKSKYYG